MKSNDGGGERSSWLALLMAEEVVAERMGKRLRDAELIVNANIGEAPKPVVKKGWT